MGQIIIEIPQKFNRTFRIISENSAQKVLLKLEQMVREEKLVEDEDILGLWPESEDQTQKLR